MICADKKRARRNTRASPIYTCRNKRTSLLRARRYKYARILHTRRNKRARLLHARRDDGQAGFSVVELLVALTLMSFLAASLISVITMGGEAFQKILDEKGARNEVRIALSYITVKIRQNGSAGKVSVIPSDSATNARNVLMIETDADKIAGDKYFIYFEEGKDGGAGRLVEKRSGAPNVDDPHDAVKIAEITDFEISYANDERTIIGISARRDTPYDEIGGNVSIALRAPPRS